MEMLQIYTRNLELTERLRDYVEAKVAKFERFLPSLETIRVDLSESNSRDSSRRMVAQITINVPKAILRAEERSGDIFTAIDAVMDKMYRRVERYKGRKAKRRPTTVTAEQLEGGIEEGAEEETVPTIVRIKEFEVHSITPEEAIEQMELLDHLFYVYLDGNDGRLSVIYRREDGNYGVLKPQY
ncbi:MAG TPA: ribosome-associated translation inhibitor RaiA [Anaerolineae bacterium]|nr:ribosome-associated translation inhibitor RaiA [Anaerolineae bacterium]HQH37376.1 ribosome-associated translation inhibitor RaiA [Anaerolineae bacterium]